MIPQDTPETCRCHVWQVRHDGTVDTIVCSWVLSRFCNGTNWHQGPDAVRRHVRAALRFQASKYKLPNWDGANTEQCREAAGKLAEKYAT